MYMEATKHQCKEKGHIIVYVTHYVIRELVLMKCVSYDTVLNQEERDAVIFYSSTGYIFLTDVSSNDFAHLS